MKRCGLVLTLASILCVPGLPQATRRIQAQGTATISAQPDQVKVDLGVTSIGVSAQDASSQNATQMTAVLAAVRQVLGPSADIKTIGYSITPNYKPQTSPPVISGYTATNTIEVTSADMNSIVKVIDTSGQAGATTITSLRFAISNDEAVREQALSAAAKQALAHAQAIASGLGGHIGNVITGHEGVSVSPVRGDTTATAAPTPIEPGLVQVTATVTISAELTQ